MKLKTARITMTTAHTAFAEVDAAVASGDAVLDLSRVDYADSALVALLLHARRELKARGHSLRIVHAPPALSRLLAAYGIETLFDGTLA